jgi:hypothetical protein
MKTELNKRGYFVLFFLICLNIKIVHLVLKSTFAFNFNEIYRIKLRLCTFFTNLFKADEKKVVTDILLTAIETYIKNEEL